MYAKQLLLLLGLTVSVSASELFYNLADCTVFYNNFVTIHEKFKCDNSTDFQQKINTSITEITHPVSEHPRDKHFYTYDELFKKALIDGAQADLIKLSRTQASDTPTTAPSFTIRVKKYLMPTSQPEMESSYEAQSIKFFLAELLLNDCISFEDILSYFLKSNQLTQFSVSEQLYMLQAWYQKSKRLRDELDLNIYSMKDHIDVTKKHILSVSGEEISSSLIGKSGEKPMFYDLQSTAPTTWSEYHQNNLNMFNRKLAQLLTLKNYLTDRKNSQTAEQCLNNLLRLETKVNINEGSQESLSVKPVTIPAPQATGNNSAQSLVGFIKGRTSASSTKQVKKMPKGSKSLRILSAIPEDTELDDQGLDDEKFQDLTDETNAAFDQSFPESRDSTDKTVLDGENKDVELEAEKIAQAEQAATATTAPTTTVVQTTESQPVKKSTLRKYTPHLLIGLGAAGAAGYAYKNNDAFANLINSGAASASNGIKSISQSLSQYAQKQGPILGKYLESSASTFGESLKNSAFTFGNYFKNTTSSFGSYLQNSWNKFDASKTFDSFVNKIDSL